jgi:ABC-type multidrug transport system permease subunit
MQAIQLAQFTLLPSIFLSGFMFPFKVCRYEQWTGEIFPATHTMRIMAIPIHWLRDEINLSESWKLGPQQMTFC